MLAGDAGTCEAAAGYYERYARLCLKDTVLVEGRVAYERGNVRRILLLFLAVSLLLVVLVVQ